MNVATAGFEELIWVVVGIFWVIAQIAGGAAKKRKPAPRPVSDGNHKPADDPFANLMSKLAGVQEFKAPTPPKPQWIEEPSPADAGPPPRSVPVQNAEGTPRLQKETPVPSLKPINPPVAEVDIRPTMSAFRNSLPAMKLPSMKLHFQCAPHHDRDVDSGKDIGRAARLDLSTLKARRRAMLSHIIFSPPKALEGSKQFLK